MSLESNTISKIVRTSSKMMGQYENIENVSPKEVKDKFAILSNDIQYTYLTNCQKKLIKDYLIRMNKTLKSVEDYTYLDKNQEDTNVLILANTDNSNIDISKTVENVMRSQKDLITDIIKVSIFLYKSKYDNKLMTVKEVKEKLIPILSLRTSYKQLHNFDMNRALSYLNSQSDIDRIDDPELIKHLMENNNILVNYLDLLQNLNLDSENVLYKKLQIENGRVEQCNDENLSELSRSLIVKKYIQKLFNKFQEIQEILPAKPAEVKELSDTSDDVVQTKLLLKKKLRKILTLNTILKRIEEDRDSIIQAMFLNENYMTDMENMYSANFITLKLKRIKEKNVLECEQLFEKLKNMNNIEKEENKRSEKSAKHKNSDQVSKLSRTRRDGSIQKRKLSKTIKSETKDKLKKNINKSIKDMVEDWTKLHEFNSKAFNDLERTIKNVEIIQEQKEEAKNVTFNLDTLNEEDKTPKTEEMYSVNEYMKIQNETLKHLEEINKMITNTKEEKDSQNGSMEKLEFLLESKTKLFDLTDSTNSIAESDNRFNRTKSYIVIREESTSKMYAKNYMRKGTRSLKSGERKSRSSCHCNSKRSADMNKRMIYKKTQLFGEQKCNGDAKIEDQSKKKKIYVILDFDKPQGSTMFDVKKIMGDIHKQFYQKYDISWLESVDFIKLMEQQPEDVSKNEASLSLYQVPKELTVFKCNLNQPQILEEIVTKTPLSRVCSACSKSQIPVPLYQKKKCEPKTFRYEVKELTVCDKIAKVTCLVEE